MTSIFQNTLPGPHIVVFMLEIIQMFLDMLNLFQGSESNHESSKIFKKYSAREEI